MCVKEGLPIKAAIVDDLAAERQQLCSLLKQYEAMPLEEASLNVTARAASAKQPPFIQVSEFNSGSALLREYTPGIFDVVFMDIFMNDENGVDCALQLRQMDPHVNLVFLTTSAEFGVKSYDVRAADYIVKPATMEKLSRALGYCQLAPTANEPTITVTVMNQPLDIALHLILYADYSNRSACIHLMDDLVFVAGKFTALADQLTAYPQFMSCFKGIVVNLKAVKELCTDYLVLKNGERLPVSRRLYRQVQHQRLSLSAGALREVSL
ncbi:LytTR family DNA-binding domain-containing protein [Anoxynatronum sibiricum]|uniref:Stage 0 sporulation protein A homolog n=1 Tax=Anoxynatronum sibiricum TaxID=210623 RepID=A0ABU9VW49_9CLOT